MFDKSAEIAILFVNVNKSHCVVVVKRHNGVPAEPKCEMVLCRHMRVSRSSGLSAGQC